MQTLTVQLTLRQKYSDPRLAAFMAEAPSSSSGPLTVVGSEVAETLWVPDTFARQDAGLAVERTVHGAQNHYARVSQDGTVLLSSRQGRENDR